jgi:hypothetical protein
LDLLDVRDRGGRGEGEGDIDVREWELSSLPSQQDPRRTPRTPQADLDASERDASASAGASASGASQPPMVGTQGRISPSPREGTRRGQDGGVSGRA